MSEMNNSKKVLKQYSNSNGLDIRIALHEKYSTNKQGFGNFLVSNYKIENGMKVLELGCGTGSIWKGHDEVINKCEKMIFSDLSEGMLKTIKENIGEKSNVEYCVIDIQNIPYEDNEFDIVIANMMLYHVPDIMKGLSEVRRVLKEGGVFYSATGGENTVMLQIADMLEIDYSQDNNFTLQNGEETLSKFFENVEMRVYEDALEITSVDDLIDYTFSGISFITKCQLSREEVKEKFISKLQDGIIKIQKEYGTFVSR